MNVQRRRLVRLSFVLLLAAAAVGSDGALSQIADDPGPAQTIRRDEAVSPPVGEGSDGLAVTDSGGSSESRLGSSGVDVVSTQCASGRGARTRLGLLEHTSVQSYCHGITGPGS